MPLSCPWRASVRRIGVLSGVIFLIVSVTSVLAVEGDKAGDVLELPPITVTGTAPEPDLSRTPASVALVPERDIRDSRGSNLEDVMQFVPGVVFHSRAGADEGKLSIRGTNLISNFNAWGLNLLINGMPIATADGFAHLEAIELLAVDHIEIYKGANALRYGANAIGGAINFVLKDGVEASRFQLRGEGGSYGFYKAQVSSGSILEPFTFGGKRTTADYYVSLSSSGQDGYRANSQQDAQRLMANVGFKWGEHEDLRLTVLVTNAVTQWPGALTLSQMFSNPRQAANGPDLTNSPFACNQNEACRWGTHFQLYRVGVTYRNEFSPEQFLEVSPSYQYWDADGSVFSKMLLLSKDYGTELRYRSNQTLWGYKQQFVIGFSPRYGEAVNDWFVNDLGARGPLLQQRRLRSLNLGGYVEEAFEATSKLTVIVGVRLDYATREATLNDYFIPGTLTGMRDAVRQYSALSPKVGFIYKTTAKSQLYGNISRAYEPPINFLLISPVDSTGQFPAKAFIDLDAQRAWQFELGHRGSTEDGRLNWDLTAYNMEMRKEILGKFINVPGVGEIGTFRNANGTRHTGVEVGAEMLLARGLIAAQGGIVDKLSARLAYTWSRFTLTDDLFVRSGGTLQPQGAAGKMLPGAPPHLLNAQVRYDHPLGFWVAPNVEWSMVGMYADYNNTVKAPSFFVMNVKSGYQYDRHLSFYLEGRNLTDKTYAGSTYVGDFPGPTPGQPRAFLPAWGVSVFGGAEYKF